MTHKTRTIGGLSVLTFMWVVLSELWTWPNILLGLFLSLGSWLLIRALHQGQTVLIWSVRNIFRWVVFAGYLAGQIYLAGFVTLRQIFQGGFNQQLVIIDTRLRDDFLISVLASAITLTPGTVTVARTDYKLHILWLNAQTDDPDLAVKHISQKLEKLLLRIQSDC